MKRLLNIRHLILVTLLSSVIFSCTKEITPIGLGIVEPNDLLSMGYSDTVKIIAYTVPDDSVYSYNLSVNNVGYVQIGSMYDPVFGTTTSSLYSSLLLTESRTRFGASPVFDSAFLYLPYYNAYGDTLSNTTFRVYNLTEGVVDSITTYSTNSLSYDPVPIGEITFQPRPHDSAYYGGAKHVATLRIPISKKFGNAMLQMDTTSLNTNADFVTKYKGICIIAEPQNTPGKGAICTFSMPSDYFKLQMHYHNPGDTVKTYTFAISYDCPRFQNYNHNSYAEAIPMLKQQLGGDISLGRQFLFAQGLAGTKIKILFPYLDKWANTKNVVINDAQLIVGNSSVSPTFPNPAYLTLRSIGENGTSSPSSIIDESDGSSRFDGSYNSTDNNYRFRLTRYIQQVLQGNIRNTGLHLVIPSSNVNGSRLILNGTSSPQSDLKLYLRYTRLQ